MDKCIQSGFLFAKFANSFNLLIYYILIGTGSYKLSCSNVTDANGDFTRNTTYYTDSIHCEGKSDPSLLKIGKLLTYLFTHLFPHSFI